MRILLQISVVALLISACSSSKLASKSEVKIYPLSATGLHGTGKYFGSKEVVQLGESIHMTKEFPLARLALFPILAEQGFDLILFEGSSVDAWIASDALLKKQTLTDGDLAKARDMAFPGIWRTDEYTQIFHWLAASWKTKHPIYLASYDFQPGMGSFKAKAIPEFLSLLKTYAPPPKDFKKNFEILARLSDRTNGFPNKFLDEKEMARITASIAWLEKWISSTVPLIQAKFPASPHARMLGQIPGQLRRQVDLWFKHSHDEKKASFLTFQETRDRLAAEAIVTIKDAVSKNKKAIVWAHHVHIFHNTLGKARHSLGHDLKQNLGTKVYTVGTFAGAGECFSLDGEEPVLTTLKPAADYGFEKKLLELSKSDYFVDLASIQDTVLDSETTTRREGIGQLATIPSKDFDAAIFVQSVTRPVPFWEKK
jgi:erythromycin esterase-like protein